MDKHPENPNQVNYDAPHDRAEKWETIYIRGVEFVPAKKKKCYSNQFLNIKILEIKSIRYALYHSQIRTKLVEILTNKSLLYKNC